MWMKDEGDHYFYICVYFNGLIYAGKKAWEFFEILENLKYKIKGFGPPNYHLGNDFKRVGEPERILTGGALTYVKRIMNNYRNKFGVEVTKKEIHAPLDTSDRT